MGRGVAGKSAKATDNFNHGTLEIRGNACLVAPVFKTAFWKKVGGLAVTGVNAITHFVPNTGCNLFHQINFVIVLAPKSAAARIFSQRTPKSPEGARSVEDIKFLHGYFLCARNGRNHGGS